MANHNGRGGVDLEPELEVAEPAAGPARRYAHTLRRGAGGASPPPLFADASGSGEPLDPPEDVTTISTFGVPMLARRDGGEPLVARSRELGPEPAAEADADLAISVALAPSSPAAIADDWWLTRVMPPAGSEVIVGDGDDPEAGDAAPGEPAADDAAFDDDAPPRALSRDAAQRSGLPMLIEDDRSGPIEPVVTGLRVPMLMATGMIDATQPPSSPALRALGTPAPIPAAFDPIAFDNTALAPHPPAPRQPLPRITVAIGLAAVVAAIALAAAMI